VAQLRVVVVTHSSPTRVPPRYAHARRLFSFCRRRRSPISTTTTARTVTPIATTFAALRTRSSLALLGYGAESPIPLIDATEAGPTTMGHEVGRRGMAIGERQSHPSVRKPLLRCLAGGANQGAGLLLVGAVITAK
jgi:hypothetical protein